MTTDVLAFYSKSRDALPGKGAHERIACPARYEELSRTPHWRRILSNFHVAPFVFQDDGRTYNSIEHAFQASKIMLADPERAALFSLDSGHEIGLGDGAVAQRNRKLVTLGPAVLDAWARISGEVMARAAACKYAQCPEARAVLGATLDAELWHIVSRKEPTRFLHLEAIRGGLPESR